MWLFQFIFIVPISLLFIVLAGVSMMYLVMGFRQMLICAREHDLRKLEGGIIAFLLSAVFLVALPYVYINWIWPW